MRFTYLALVVMTTIGVGILSGLFFIFSNTVMGALNSQSPNSAVRTMQAINTTILNPLFFIVFFGTPLLCVMLIVLDLSTPGNNVFVLSASICHLLGAFCVTLFKNVPMNNQLAELTAGDEPADQYWQIYFKQWTLWNHVRTFACVLSMSLLLLGLSMKQL